MKLVLVKRQPETADAESFFWRPEQPINFKPGQYLKWTIDDDKPDDRGNSRFFSISSSPTEPLIMNTTKFNLERSSSFKTVLKYMSEGDSLNGFGPIGSFVLDEDLSDPVVMIAGGIGITPFRSMLKYLADTGLERSVHLLYACQTPDDIAFKKLLDRIASEHDWLSLTYIVQSAKAGWNGEIGRLNAERILEMTGGLDGKKAYLSGPEAMTRALYDGLLFAGVSESSLLTDYFPGYTER